MPRNPFAFRRDSTQLASQETAESIASHELSKYSGAWPFPTRRKRRKAAEPPSVGQEEMVHNLSGKIQTETQGLGLSECWGTGVSNPFTYISSLKTRLELQDVQERRGAGCSACVASMAPNSLSRHHGQKRKLPEC